MNEYRTKERKKDWPIVNNEESKTRLAVLRLYIQHAYFRCLIVAGKQNCLVRNQGARMDPA